MGITGYYYGGTDDDDNSGTLSYVRVWHGGAVIGADNEINGITFAGVGTGTSVDHIEVAFNLDDGIEFFGGTVNVKYASVLFVGDDSIDTDMGYSGKIQFAFVLIGQDGHHGTEMDSKYDNTPRSFPQMYNALFVSQLDQTVQSVSTDDTSLAVMRLREGTGGEFGNIIITNNGYYGVYSSDCGTETRTQTLPSSNGVPSSGAPDYLWFSDNNIIYNGGSNGIQFSLGTECTWSPSSPSAISVDPELTMIPTAATESVAFLDPRPIAEGASFASPDTNPVDGFFEATSYKGAFSASDLWLSGWSWLSDNAKLPDNIAGTVVLGGEITSATTWLAASSPYLLTGQVYIGGSATLTIEPGVTIYGYKDDGFGTAPCLVVEAGASISAVGTPSAPITFTSALPSSLYTPSGGLWGGLIIMGDASVYGGTDEVEGITGYYYGGSDDSDNSGTLSYVRVWYGGAVIGSDNEINGITFAGVGSGTTVEYCEVAFNLDDGFEWFGGTVNAKYLSVLFAGDDALDTDLGFRGKIQFAYVMVGSSGNHGTEMDSKWDGTPRSYPQLYGATFIGHMNHVVGSVSTDDTAAAILRFREGTGGEFGNILVYNTGTYGVKNNDCTGAGITATQDSSAIGADVLFFSSNNVIYGNGDLFDIDSSCEVSGVWTDSAATAVTSDPTLALMPYDADTDTAYFDPRPSSATSILFSDVDAVPDDGFFTQTSYKGAFAEASLPDSADLWIAQFSWLDENARIPKYSLTGTVIEASEITAATTWSLANSPYMLTDQVFVASSLTIEAGVTVYAYGDDGTGP